MEEEREVVRASSSAGLRESVAPNEREARAAVASSVVRESEK